MVSVDDDKGGSYHGPYAWPGGVPIVSAEEVDEVRKMQQVHAYVREDVKDSVISMIADETGIFSKNHEEIVEDIAFQMGNT